MSQIQSCLPSGIVQPIAAGRVLWVDYAKGIGIILVVFGHTWRGLWNAGMHIPHGIYRTTDSFVYAFHMPLFFFVSGIFLERSLQRSFGSFLTDKLKVLAYPYIVWVLIDGLAKSTMSRYTNTPASLRDVVPSFLWDPPGMFWFLYTLLAGALLFGTLYRAGFPAGAIFFLAVAFCLTEGLPLGSWGVVYQLRRYWIFLAAGAFLGGAVQKSLPNMPTLILAASALFGFVAVSCGVAAQSFLQGSFAALPTVLRPAFVTLCASVQAAVGIAMALALAVILQRASVRFIRYLGAMSLEIYVAHVIAASGIRIVMQKFAHVNAWGPHVMIGTLAGLLLPLLLANISARIGFPYLFTLRRNRSNAASGVVQTVPRHSPAAL